MWEREFVVSQVAKAELGSRRGHPRHKNKSWRGWDTLMLLGQSVLLSAVGRVTSAAARLQPMRRSFTSWRAKAPSAVRGAVMEKKSARFDVLEVERGAGVGCGVGNFDVAHFEIAHVAQEKP